MHAADRDPQGHFAALGLAPGVGTDAVKAAFHAQAKRLHPDRNAAPDAGTAFQRVAEAYQVLRDPLRRLGYEAFGDDQPAGVIRPQACEACGRVSAQPRVVAFKLVRSCLVAARRDETVGIFCPACARAAALRASFSTWLLGWWSLPGLVLTPYALAVNLLGGIKPRAPNFRLLVRQARAFMARGEAEVAVALAAQARAFAADPRDRASLSLVVRDVPARRLRDGWGLVSRAFVLQALPMAGLAAVLAVAAAILEDLA